jgi:pimeloyl-ACP methyl ester carboxylesterase
VLWLQIAVLLWFGAIGCNVVRIAERRMDRTFVRAGLNPQTWQNDSHTLHYFRGGTGPPLLLLHGFGGDARWQWRHQVEPFADTHTLLVPDLPGFGESSWLGPAPSIEQQAELMASLLEHEGLRDVAVVGISYGGLVAWQLAHRHPEHVDRLVIVDSPGPAYQREDLDELLRRFGESDAADIIVPREPDDVRRLLELAYAHPPATPVWALRQVLREMFLPRQRDQRALIARLVHDLEHYAEQREPPQMPALLVWGRDDPVFPLEIGERLNDLWRETTTLVVIDDSRHAPNLEHPSTFNRVVARFLDECLRRGERPCP